MSTTRTGIHSASGCEGTATSPRLQVRFALTPETLLLFYPNGQPFLSSVELARRAEEASARAEQEMTRAEQESARAEQEMTRAEQESVRAEQESARAEQESVRAVQEAARADAEHTRAERLAERLRTLGIDPD